MSAPAARQRLSLRPHCPPLRCARPTGLQGRAVDGLKALRKQRVSTKVLSETQAGKRVKALAKHSKQDIAAAASAVVAAWKEAVKQEADGGGAASGAASASLGGSSKAAASAPASSSRQAGTGEGPDDAQPSSQQTVAGGGASPAPPPPPLEPEAVPRSGDSLRDKCRYNLASDFQLAVGEGVEGDPVVCGVAVENEIFKQNGGVTQVGGGGVARGSVAAGWGGAGWRAGAARLAGWEAGRPGLEEEPVAPMSQPTASAPPLPRALAPLRLPSLPHPALPLHPPQAYKAKFRNLHFNLKDAANPDLRRKVGGGGWCVRGVVCARCPPAPPPSLLGPAAAAAGSRQHHPAGAAICAAALRAAHAATRPCHRAAIACRVRRCTLCCAGAERRGGARRAGAAAA